METYTVTRQIGIDAGHRVMTHGSKCRHLHGHRYQIEATCSARNAKLHRTGEQTDMVIDFSFLKDEMLHHIDAPCDHGLIATIADVELLQMFCPTHEEFADWVSHIQSEVQARGYCETTNTQLSSKLYVIQHQPTAECLAAHWFHRLVQPIHERSDGIAVLTRIRVWETPNCYSDYINPDIQS
ncbi:MAG: 6-carboxytetrahydropterin synthase [Magnetovibrio sp.]|nr:6-carboxytetrahydropterin synthase [Magnetovibrio sp.]